MTLGKFYRADFNHKDMASLEHELGLYIDNVLHDTDFANLETISDLSRLTVDSRKHLSYQLVYRLVKQAPTLHFVTIYIQVFSSGCGDLTWASYSSAYCFARVKMSLRLSMDFFFSDRAFSFFSALLLAEHRLWHHHLRRLGRHLHVHDPKLLSHKSKHAANSESGNGVWTLTLPRPSWVREGYAGRVEGGGGRRRRPEWEGLVM
jgi:hypothetical protein